jgi:Zn-dependent protease
MVCRAAGLQDTAPDLFRFAVALAWINGYLLLFNILPVYPLDGGQMLQALLWLVMGRARSLLVMRRIQSKTGRLYVRPARDHHVAIPHQARGFDSG